MVYESDFYTTRRYRTSPSLSTYTVSKREIPWEKVPFVPRPSLVQDPVTAFGKRQLEQKEAPKESKKYTSILSPIEKARIRPRIIIPPPRPYVSPRDATRERVFGALRKEEMCPKELQGADAMDIVLPKLFKIAELPDLPYKRKIALASSYY